MTAELPDGDTTPPPDPHATIEPIDWEGERVPGTYDRMVLDRPFRTYRFTVTLDQQREYCDGTADRAPLYLEGARPAAHPGLVMAQGSRVVANQFVMPFWIHAGSVLRHRRLIRVGDDVELACVPIEKWRRRQRLGALLPGLPRRRLPAIEVWKTSVIQVAQRAAATPS